MKGKTTQGRKRLHLLNDLMKGKNVTENVKSWKSYTCFSAEYLNA